MPPENVTRQAVRPHLPKQASDELLKQIIEWTPRVQNADQLLKLAEAYALVMGKTTSRFER